MINVPANSILVRTLFLPGRGFLFFFFCCVLTGFSLVGGGGVCVHVMYVCMYTHMYTHRSAVASYKDTNAVGSRPHPSASFDSASLEVLFK